MPISHKLNVDGYFRKRWGNEIEMFHRFIYRAHKGEIPECHEVDHKCRNRACCNPDHLQAIDGLEHTILTNTTRYQDRKAAAYKYWMEHKCTGTLLGKLFGVSWSCACNWIRHWKTHDKCRTN